ncbi:MULTISPECIES: hypothetical protein [unclassified Exiguobacterium]|uniref:hypothetical protein n=1 Tax=unclassified Exiguobacterium TaxID=2644629 RepID=UPI001BE8503C|nr:MULTISPECIES: hypothetical protein [unclassified Exiguobacterium]
MENQSNSNSRSQQLIISQAVNSIKQHGMEDILHEAAIYDINGFVASLYQEHYALENIENAYKKIRYYSFMKLKRRWVKTAIRNYQEGRGYNKELRAQHDMISAYLKVAGPEGLYREFHVKSVEDYMQLCITKIQEWAEDPNRLLHTYPYWSQKTLNQKTSTLKTDVLMVLGEVAKEIDLTQRVAHHSPTLAVDIPFFGMSDRIKNKTDHLDERLNDASQLNLDLLNYESVVPKYKEGVPHNLSVLVSKEFIQELNGKVPDLDSKDFEAFTEILSYRDISFQTSRKIIFPLVRLVEKLYANKSGKSYDLTTKRLMKLGYYRVAGHNDEGDFFIRGLFSSVTIRNATTLADSQVVVTVTEEVYDDLLKQQIVSIYGEQIEQLTGSFAYHLAFVLQKERMASIQSGEENPVRRHWRQFTYSIRFNKSRKSENLMELEANLDRIKEHEFILKDWHRSGDYYFFTFYPLESWEMLNHNDTLLL